MDTTNIIGYVATTLTTAMTLPQLIKIVRTRHAADVSIWMFILNLSGTILWFIYGVMLRAFPIIVGNVVAFFIVSSIIVLKLKYDRALVKA